VTAVDVNERAVLLANENAASLGVGERFAALTPDSVPAGATYDELWSNPPIRIGKAALHELLLTWFARLVPGGRATFITYGYWDEIPPMLWLDEQIVKPDLDAMARVRWPDIRIQEARYPKHDAQRLTAFTDGQFDLVYSHQVLEHIPKPWLAGAELVRVLKSGGIGIHTTCAYNPRHGLPAFNDYYRFLPDGLAELFDGVEVLVKAGWGNRQALLYNLAIDDGHGGLGGRRFHPKLAEQNDPNHPWVTWIIFRKR